MGTPNPMSPVELTTYGGIAIAVVMIANGLKSAWNFNPLRTALLASCILCLAVYLANTQGPTAMGVITAVINGFAVYLGAIGANGLAANALGAASSEARHERHLIGPPAMDTEQHMQTLEGQDKKPFFTRWL